MKQLTLTRDEEIFLKSKYKDLGMTKEQARGRLGRMKQRLSDLVEKLTREGRTEKDINKEFKKEFWSLIEKEEKKRKKGGVLRKIERKPKHKKA